MKEGFLILLLSLFSSLAIAQSTTTPEPEKQTPAEQQEKVAPAPADAQVKTVPAAKGAAKPQRVVTKGKKAKPTVGRPARNPRPAARVRPGRGR